MGAAKQSRLPASSCFPRLSDNLGLFDTHCHLTDDQFGDGIDEVLDRADRSGVSGILSVATDLEDSKRVLSLTNTRNHLRAAVGIHPNYAVNFDLTSMDSLKTLAEIRTVKAIGEIGLDFYREFTPPDKQIEAFEAQLRLAADLALPVVVHNRQADDEIMERLEDHSRAAIAKMAGRPLGILHCFSGDRELARRALDAGYLISLAGNLTYKSADNLRAVAKWLPANVILIETDAPYLAPVPFRGKRNEPKHLVDTFRVLTEIRKTTSVSLAGQLRSNCRRIFGWPARRDGNADSGL